MHEVLLIAAGGGGDVIGAVMVAESLGLTQRDASVATLAWERLLVDPVPGPRSTNDFKGLLQRGNTFEVLPTTRTCEPYGSLLPRLRRDLGYQQFLLDPRAGVSGLVTQLQALEALLNEPREVWLVDVGGDVLATGAEAGLRSPLCDALTLAATTQLGGAPRLLVAGPGLDGELTPTEIQDRLRKSSATLVATLDAPSENVMSVLEWHPTEASALLAASADGIRGRVEIRDAGTPIDLTPQSAQLWSMPAVDALPGSTAQDVLGTTSLSEAEQAMKGRLGWTELDHERRKARILRQPDAIRT